MAYTPIMPNMKLTAQDMGVPDYQNALLRGLEGSQQASNTINTPRQLSENYLKSVLANKINQPKADNAQESYDTDIGYKKALTNQANRLGGPIGGLIELKNSFPEGSSDRALIEGYLTNKGRTTGQARADLETQKELQKTQDAMDELLKHSHSVEEIHRILDENPDLGGFVSGWQNKFGMGGEAGKELQGHALDIQTGLTKQLSSLGGSRAAGIVAQAKPDIGQNHKANEGAVKALLPQMREAYKLLQEKHQRLSGGKEYPHQLGHLFDKIEQGVNGTPNKSTNGNANKVKYKPAPPGYTLVANEKTGKVHKVRDDLVPAAIVDGGYVYEQ